MGDKISFTVNLSPEDKAALDRVAEFFGMNKSALLRACIRRWGRIINEGDRAGDLSSEVSVLERYETFALALFGYAPGRILLVESDIPMIDDLLAQLADRYPLAENFIRRYYGLTDGGQCEGHDEIAQSAKVTVERVRQVMARGLRYLRNPHRIGEFRAKVDQTLPNIRR